MKKPWILGSLALATALFGACGGTKPGGGTTTTDTTSGSAGAGGAADTYGAGPCRACVATACESEIDACKADPECPKFLACLDACPTTGGGDADPACVAACPTGSGTETKKAVGEINLCREKGAGVSCQACGLSPQTTYTSPVLNQTCPNPSTETNPCYVCIDEKCCETYETCHNDAECQAVKNCLGTCADSACMKTCTEQHPAGSDVLGPYIACGIVLCAADQNACDATLRDACMACFYGDCGDAYASFLAAPGGYAMEACINTCPIDDAVCDQGCYDAYPEAFAMWGDLASCVAVVCKGKC